MRCSPNRFGGSGSARGGGLANPCGRKPLASVKRRYASSDSRCVWPSSFPNTHLRSVHQSWMSAKTVVRPRFPATPALCPVRGRLSSVPLGYAPFLHCLRGECPLVRQGSSVLRAYPTSHPKSTGVRPQYSLRLCWAEENLAESTIGPSAVPIGYPALLGATPALAACRT